MAAAGAASAGTASQRPGWRRAAQVMRLLALLCACGGAALAAAPATGPAEPRLLFAGADQAAWLVRRDASSPTFDVAVRTAGGSWRLRAERLTGRPVAAVASTGQLHVFFANPTAQVVLSLAGGSTTPALDPNHPCWPRGAAPLALCEGADPNTGQALGILAAVGHGGAPAPVPASATWTSAPGTLPGTRAATPHAPASHPPAPGSWHVAIFERTGAHWAFLTDCPDVPLPAGSRVLLAAAGDSIYLLVWNPVGEAAILRRWDGAAWAELPLGAELAAQQPVALLDVEGGLRLLTAKPAAQADRHELIISTWQPQRESFSSQGTLLGDKPATWPAGSPPQAARLAGQLALLWREDGKLHFGTCQPRMGQLVPLGPVDVFDAGRPSQVGDDELRMWFWILLLAALAPLVLLRPRQGAKPFMLPPWLPPGGLGRRLLASVIDLLPVLFPIAFIYSLLPGAVPHEELSEIHQRILEGRQADMPVQLVALSLAILVGYAAYGIVLEAKWGTTPGKRLMGLRVVASEGQRPTLRQCLLRNLLKIVELVSLWPFFPLLLLVPAFTRYRQRVGDMIARTAVVDARARPPEEPPRPPPFPPPREAPRAPPPPSDAAGPPGRQD